MFPSPWELDDERLNPPLSVPIDSFPLNIIYFLNLLSNFQFFWHPQFMYELFHLHHLGQCQELNSCKKNNMETKLWIIGFVDETCLYVQRTRCDYLQYLILARCEHLLLFAFFKVNHKHFHKHWPWKRATNCKLIPITNV